MLAVQWVAARALANAGKPFESLFSTLAIEVGPARKPISKGVVVSIFQATVSALCYSIYEERCRELASEREFPQNAVVRFVLGQHAGMPDFLQVPFACVTLLFGLSSVVRHGRMFHQLPHTVRWRQVEGWRTARISVCRDLIRFYESFVVFHAYSAGSRKLTGQTPIAAAARTAA